jgi:hypothetical protein
MNSPQNLQPIHLPLPSLLAKMLTQDRWRQPPDDVIRKLVPFISEPLNFLLSESDIRRESLSLGRLAKESHLSIAFRIYYGATMTPKCLPWLDAGHALIIAVNRLAGEDVAIALDYRSDYEHPIVVASAWTEPSGSMHPSLTEWREVAPSFEAFVASIGF